MLNKYLPLGTVCILKGSKKKVMIIGYNKNYPSKSIMYDYIACDYPDGLSIDKNKTFFLHNLIDKVCFVGYNDKEQKELLEKFNSEITSQSNEVNNVQINTQKLDNTLDTNNEIDYQFQQLLNILPNQVND